MVKRTVHPARAKLLRAARNLDGKKVSVGFFADQGTHTDSNMTYPELMYLQEVHGVRSKNGLVHRRLFELTAMTHRDEILRNLNASARRNLLSSPQRVLKAFGQDIKGKLQSGFGNTSLLPPNAASTRKKKNTPLVDSGELKSKVTYRITSRKPNS